VEWLASLVEGLASLLFEVPLPFLVLPWLAALLLLPVPLLSLSLWLALLLWLCLDLLGFRFWCFFLFFLLVVLVIILVVVFVFVEFVIDFLAVFTKIFVLFVIILVLCDSCYDLLLEGLGSLPFPFRRLRAGSSGLQLRLLLFRLLGLEFFRDGLRLIGLEEASDMQGATALGEEGDVIEQGDEEVDDGVRAVASEGGDEDVLAVLAREERDLFLGSGSQDHVGDRQHLALVLLRLLRRELVALPSVQDLAEEHRLLMIYYTTHPVYPTSPAESTCVSRTPHAAFPAVIKILKF
jgi:hypothetical protein